jgi:T5SS/PEP-CTERM-associated repeat protein
VDQSGRLNVTLDNQVQCSSATIGYDGNGALTVTGGGTVSSNYGYVGRLSGSSGEVTVDGGTWEDLGYLYVGYSGHGTLTVAGGATVSSNYGYVGVDAGADGEVTVDGGTWEDLDYLYIGYDGNGALTVAGDGNVTNYRGYIGFSDGSEGQVTVDGGTWTSDDRLTVGYDGNGALTVTGGGSVTNNYGYVGLYGGSSGEVTVGGGGAAWTNAGDLALGGSTTSAGGTGTVSIHAGGTVSVGDRLVLWPDGTLNIIGGSVVFGRAQGVDDRGGTLNYVLGTVAFDCNVAVGLGGSDVPRFFGPSPAIPAGKALEIRGEATLWTPMTIDGGRLAVGALVNAPLLSFDRGTFELTDADMAVCPGGLFGDLLEVAAQQTYRITNTATVGATGQLRVTGGAFGAGELVNHGLVELAGATARIGGDTLTNAGVLTGTGRVHARLANQVGGSVQVGAGEEIVFTAPGGTNAGQIEALAGEVEFAQGLTNTAGTGTITGRDAVLRFLGGLLNEGALSLTAGTNDVFGDADNAGGSIVVTGGAHATFHGDVVNTGTFRVSADSTGVFLGAFDGNGVGGPGAKYFEGDLRPGASPGVMAFQGDVYFTPTLTAELELGGTAAGDEYDVLDFENVQLDGLLEVVLIDGYDPQLGDTFDILNWAALAGEFDGVSLPALSPGLAWDDSALYDTGEIGVVPEPAALSLLAFGALALLRRRR